MRASPGDGRPRFRPARDGRLPRKVASVLLLLLAAVGSSGCAAFRAQFGGGIGLGADIKLPGLLHTGLSAGQYMNVGIRYDEPELSNDVNAAAIAWHWEGRYSKRPEGRRLICEHSSWAVVPPLTAICENDRLAAWDFEIGIMLLVIDFRFGFNPLRLNNPDKRPPPRPAPPRPAPSGAKAGVDGPPPPPRDPSGRLRPTYDTDPLLPPTDPPPERGGG